MKVMCKIVQCVLENEHGAEVDSVRAECLRCEHVTESFGTGDASKKRCLAQMREGCPEGEENYYADEDA